MCMEVANLDYADKVYCPEDGNNASLESFVDFNSNDYEKLVQYTPYVPSNDCGNKDTDSNIPK